MKGRFFVFALLGGLLLLMGFSCSTIPGSDLAGRNSANDTKATSFNYADAFAKSILFYEANWCGKDAGNNRLAWRGPCHTNDGADVGLDLTGGFHDCGDHVKFGLPQVYAASTLGWAYYEFKDVFTAKGQDTYMKNILLHFADYFLRCFPNNTTFHYQVGDGTTDHSYWGPPELQTEKITTRPTLYSATPSKPASDVCGTAAAALALTYLNFSDTKYLTAAKNLYAFGKNYKGLSESGGFYGSSGYWDDLCWGAVWLYIATGDSSYMNDINTFLSNKGITDSNPYNNHWTHCWDDVWGGVFIKLAQITNRQLFKFVAEENLSYWLSNITRSPGGLCFLNTWGNCRYVAAECMMALVYYKTATNQAYLDFAKSQIDYILGNNPKGWSYEVGFGSTYPKFPHHRAASGRFECQPANESKKDPEKHLLYGALVGGPGNDDAYTDDIEDYVHGEVGIDFNAGFVGALAGIVKAYGTSQTPEATPGIEPTNSPYFVSAYVVDENNQHSTIRAYIHNDSLLPPHYEKGLSFRYFVNLSEYSNTSGLTCSAYYNPSGATISPLTVWDAANNVYYVEVTFTNEIYSKVPFEFCFANYNNNLWNPANDYSRTGLTTGTNDVLTEYIPVYRNGTLIFGKEPAKGSASSSVSSSRSSAASSISSSRSSAVSSVTSSRSSVVSSISSSRSSVVSSISSSRSSAVSSAISSVTSSVSSVQYTEISIPFTKDGAGEFYWKTKGFSTTPNDYSHYVNSWNLDILEINGTSYVNKWIATFQIPAASDGYWYIHYKGSYSYSHLEIK